MQIQLDKPFSIFFFSNQPDNKEISQKRVCPNSTDRPIQLRDYPLGIKVEILPTPR